MAAGLALVMLSVLASIGFFVAVLRVGGPLASAFAGATFVLLALGALGAALHVVRDAKP